MEEDEEKLSYFHVGFWDLDLALEAGYEPSDYMSALENDYSSIRKNLLL